jgi:Txe/YoeB family toxin of Txe-Axe toxin-antitoxin module
MNLPFGLFSVKDMSNIMKEEAKEVTTMYEHKLAEYRTTLENYKRWLLEYADKLETSEHRNADQKLISVQTALDLTYLKEQGDRTMDLLEDLNKGSISNIQMELEKLNSALMNANESLEGVDKNVVNRISELLIEIQKQTAFQNKQHQTDLTANMELLGRRVTKGHTLLWFLFIFNLISISGLAFLILYVLEIIPF